MRLIVGNTKLCMKIKSCLYLEWSYLKGLVGRFKFQIIIYFPKIKNEKRALNKAVAC